MEPFTETVIISGIPKGLHAGLRLEHKNGEICLRLADMVKQVAGDSWEVVRTWERPGDQPFPQEIFGNPTAPNDHQFNT